MNKPTIRSFFCIVFLLGHMSVVTAQKTTVYTHSDVDFKTGIELFQKEKYGAAQKHFNKITESNHTTSALLLADAEYYSAICATELFNKDGEFYLKEFIKKHPENNKVKTAYFYLGKYNYRKKKYKEVLDWFDKVDIYDLTTDELAEFYFKRGYSYFNSEKHEFAAKDFYEIKDVDNAYRTPARYYFAHISYSRKNYEVALKEFNALKKDETFGSVASLYIVQLYHLQKKYDSVISLAPRLLDTINSKRAPEIARIIGEAYYNKGKYKEAIPYFKKYEEAFGELSREGNYQVGFANYKIQNYTDGLIHFIKATASEQEEDSLSQSIAYHMGDSYLKLNQKQKALNAFKKASSVDFDKSIEEDALFNYAKLNYEISNSPYSEAIKVLKRYIKNYPETARADEAYTYLVNAFITTKNYKQALSAIDNIKSLTPDLKVIYQKAAYYQGVSYFNEEGYIDAIDLFDKSLRYNFDKNIKAASIYWKAEAYYRLKDYDKAITTYKEYILEPGAIGKPEHGEANYNVGYSFYNLKDYESSNLWFRKFVTFKPQADERKINDAYNRIGDGYFMQRNFANASEYYGLSYKMKLVDADYALYQKALAEGVQKKYSQKITDLQLFIKEYTLSSYIQKAKYELALTYLADNQNDQALSAFLQFIDEYPNSAYLNTCLSKIGLIYYNRKDDAQALEYFDKLIMRDRKSPEANEAIVIVKTIYKSKGEVQQMEEYLKSRGEVIPEASLDSITYDVAKNHFMEQNCSAAIASLKKYIEKFPNGIFITESHFQKAECEYSTAKIDDALESYLFVSGKNKNQFTEKSVYRSANILYQKQNYAKAQEYYTQLEQQAENTKNRDHAIIHLMRCDYRLNKYDEAVEYANKVLAIEKISNDIIYEAHYIIAKSMYAQQKFDDALAEFRVVANSTKNELGAESQYYIALVYHTKGDFKIAEKSIYDLINSEVNSPYWVTKSLLLLADNYVAQKDNFQAKTILNSVLTDSDIPELIKLAQEKLDKINADEAAAKVVKPVVVPEQIMFDDNDDDQQLFVPEQQSVPQKTEEGGNVK
jgi:tetratricopeptide (TPR) repeat protein